MVSKTSSDKLSCSFCGKTQDDVKKLIAGPSVYICNECVDLCNDIIEEEIKSEEDTSLEELPSLKIFMAFDYIICAIEDYLQTKVSQDLPCSHLVCRQVSTQNMQMRYW